MLCYDGRLTQNGRQADPELAALSDSSAVSAASSASSLPGTTPATSQQSNFDQKPEAYSAAPRQARLRQTTNESDTLRPPLPGQQSRKNSYAARHDINGTVLREGDVGNGMHTIRPVRRFDSVSSNRASADFIERRSSFSSADTDRIPPSSSVPVPATGRDASMGRTLVEEVVHPVIEKVSAIHSR